MKILVCTCGKEFKVFPYRKNARHCSSKCYHDNCVGNKLSEKTKEKMSKAHGQPLWLIGQEVWNKGKKGLQIPWNKDKICPQLRGENHPNWQGGITKEVRRIRNSTEYKLWRKSVFERDKFKCQICNQVGGRLEADHIKPFSKFPELRLDIDNGRTLCKECHKSTPTYLNRANCANYRQ